MCKPRHTLAFGVVSCTSPAHRRPFSPLLTHRQVAPAVFKNHHLAAQAATSSAPANPAMSAIAASSSAQAELTVRRELEAVARFDYQQVKVTLRFQQQRRCLELIVAGKVSDIALQDFQGQPRAPATNLEAVYTHVNALPGKAQGLARALADHINAHLVTGTQQFTELLENERIRLIQQYLGARGISVDIPEVVASTALFARAKKITNGSAFLASDAAVVLPPLPATLPDAQIAKSAGVGVREAQSLDRGSLRRGPRHQASQYHPRRSTPCR